MNTYPHWWDDPHAEEHGWLIQGWEVPGYPHLTVHQVSGRIEELLHGNHGI